MNQVLVLKEFTLWWEQRRRTWTVKEQMHLWSALQSRSLVFMFGIHWVSFSIIDFGFENLKHGILALQPFGPLVLFLNHVFFLFCRRRVRCMWVWVHTEARGWPQMSSSVTSPPCMLKQVLLLNLELIDSAGLACYKSSGVLLYLLHQCCGLQGHATMPGRWWGLDSEPYNSSLQTSELHLDYKTLMGINRKVWYRTIKWEENVR